MMPSSWPLCAIPTASGRSSAGGFKGVAGMWRRRPNPSSTRSCGPSPGSSCAWRRDRRTSRLALSGSCSTASRDSLKELQILKLARNTLSKVFLKSRRHFPGPALRVLRAFGWAVVPWRRSGSSRDGSRRGCSRRSSPGLLRVPCSRACAAAGSRSWPPPWRPAARRRTGSSWPGFPRVRARRSSPGSSSWGWSSASTSRTAPPAR